ncbi:MAG TPA: hypothetical protein GX513_01020 [Firmicutes bacterium]|nr:hypothetical protein [Bacillota bacterium]
MSRRWARRLANSLTASRAAIVLMILLEATGECSPRGITRVVLLGLVGWTTDVLDGKAARYSRTPGGIWGRLDFPLDVALAWVSGWVFSVWGYVPGDWFLGYAVLAGAFALLRPTRATVMAFEVPVLLIPIWVGWRTDLRLGLAYLLWIAVMLCFDWRRFWEVVGSFIDGLPPGARDYLSRALAPLLKRRA